MPTRRAFLAAPLLTAATPAAAAIDRLVSVYGDSATAGSYSATPLAAQRSYLAVRPVARMVQALGAGWAGIDRGIPGWGTGEHWLGWESTIAMDPASITVLRFGAGDAALSTDPVVFEARLLAMTRIVQAAGKRAVLPGVIHVARRPEWQDPIGVTAEVISDKARWFAEMDQRVRNVSSATGGAFVDIRALRFDGAVDIADAVHPAQGYANRCADAIAVAILS